MSKRVLLIQPPFERLMGYSRYYSNIGLLSLAGVIENGGHEIMVYDADYNPDGTSYSTLELYNEYSKYVDEFSSPSSKIWDEIQDVIEEYNPDVIGITVLTVTLDSAKKVASIAREVKSNVTIFTGGVHATMCPEDLVEFSDYVIQNEGESVVLDVIEGNVQQKIIKGDRILDLDSLPLPAIHCLYNLENYNVRDLSMVISSRGCPNACKFCNSPAIWKRKVVRKSVDYFIKEIKHVRDKYGVKEFFIADDSFSYDNKWLIKFCEEVKKLNVKWRCLDRVDYVTQEKLDLMREAGCINIKYGIESGCQRTLDRVSKNIKIEDVYRVNELLTKNNINWGAYFIVGFPGETKEDILMTKSLIESLSANCITVSIFTPYPGNGLYGFDKLDYKQFSHHSPNNNFTGVLSDDEFHELVKEILVYVETRNREYDNGILIKNRMQV